MIQREFGNTGEKVSVLGMGTAPLGLQNYQGKDDVLEQDAIALIQECVNCGVTYFDTAPVYGKKIQVSGWNSDRRSEMILGKALEKVPRDKVFIATKNMYDRTEPGMIRKSLEDSLRLLHTDYVDLFQIHGYFALPYRADNWRDFVTDTVIEEITKLKEEGKCRYLGISGWREGGICAAIESNIFQAVMPLFNYFYRGAEWELVKLAEKNGTAVVPMRPLTGNLMSKEFSDIPTEMYQKLGLVKRAINYLLSFSVVSTLPVGMRTIEELYENLEIIEECEKIRDTDNLE